MRVPDPALVLDFGGPALRTPFELAATTDPLLDELLTGRGPFAPADAPDPDWSDLMAGRITEVAYWQGTAERWRTAGGGPDLRALFTAIYEPPRAELIRHEAPALVRDAQRAGIPVAILTNDMLNFHGADWVARMGFVHTVDHLVDGAVEGVMKPDPRAYEIVADRLGARLTQLVFLDDQPVNLRGAEALGIHAVEMDVTDPASGYARVRELLGLQEAS